MSDMIQSLLFADPATPEPSLETLLQVPQPPVAWAKLAIEAAFGTQKTRWRAFDESQQAAIMGDMWAYSLRRAQALKAPRTAAQAEPALLGWINQDPQLALMVGRLSAALIHLPLSSIPTPDSNADAAPSGDAQEQPTGDEVFA